MPNCRNKGSSPGNEADYRRSLGIGRHSKNTFKGIFFLSGQSDCPQQTNTEKELTQGHQKGRQHENTDNYPWVINEVADLFGKSHCRHGF